MKSNETNSKIVSKSHDMDLSAEEVVKLKVRVEAGDGEAAFRLSSYYGIGKQDVVNQLVWLKKAAELNSAAGQYNLAYILVFDSKNKDLNQADYWLRKAADHPKKEKDNEFQELIRGVRRQLDIELKGKK